MDQHGGRITAFAGKRRSFWRPALFPSFDAGAFFLLFTPPNVGFCLVSSRLKICHEATDTRLVFSGFAAAKSDCPTETDVGAAGESL
jgi:hypothetical protein